MSISHLRHLPHAALDEVELDVSLDCAADELEEDKTPAAAAAAASVTSSRPISAGRGAADTATMNKVR